MLAKKIFPLFLCILWGFWGQGAAVATEEQHAQYHKISALDAQRLMRETGSFILLDVRTDAEYRELRIPGAKLLPEYELAGRAASELPDKNIPIFVYCRSGRRSESATRKLVSMGYTQVYDLGGIMDWPYAKEK